MKCSDCSDLIDELTKDDNVCFSFILVCVFTCLILKLSGTSDLFCRERVWELNCIPVCTCIFPNLMPSLLPFNTQQVTVEKLQYNKTEDLCYCVMSYVHYHDAVSPAFLEEDYTSQEYSTWVESRYVTVDAFSTKGMAGALAALWHFKAILDIPCVSTDGGLLT